MGGILSFFSLGRAFSVGELVEGSVDRRIAVNWEMGFVGTSISVVRLLAANWVTGFGGVAFPVSFSDVDLQFGLIHSALLILPLRPTHMMGLSHDRAAFAGSGDRGSKSEDSISDSVLFPSGLEGALSSDDDSTPLYCRGRLRQFSSWSLPLF